MKAQIKLGRIFGVEIGLHYSWFLIALLITLSLAAQFRLNNPDWSDGLRWGLAITTALLFFAAIVAHELSHALVAKSRGLPVRSITLFALGGVAQIEERSCRRQDRILDGNRRPDYEPGDWCDLSWDSASDGLDAAWVSCTTPARDAHVAWLHQCHAGRL